VNDKQKKKKKVLLWRGKVAIRGNDTFFNGLKQHFSLTHQISVPPREQMTLC